MITSPSSVLDRDKWARRPLLSGRGIAHLVGKPTSQIHSWAQPKNGGTQIVTSSGNGHYKFPVTGLADAHVATKLQDNGLSTKNVRKIAAFARSKYGQDGFALSKWVTDGTDLLRLVGDDLERFVDSRGAFLPVLEPFMTSVRRGNDGELSVKIDRFTSCDVSVNPFFNRGHMSLTRNRIPLFGPAGQLVGGDSVETVARDFCLTREEADEIDQNKEWILKEG